MTIYKALSLPEQVALQREVEELRADAERLRWMAYQAGETLGVFRSAIDAAMNKEQPK